MIVVKKHINDISINPFEYLLDENKKVMEFESKDEAIAFLKRNGFTDSDIYYLVIEEVQL